MCTNNSAKTPTFTINIKQYAMEHFLQNFEDMPLYIRFGWLVGCITLAWILEGAYSFMDFKYNKWEHAKTNFALLGFTMLINVVFGILTVGVFEWIKTNEIGFLFYVDLPFWVELLIAVLALDLFAQYIVHYLAHKIPWLWRFHMIHHSDTHLDASSGTRHHPGDFIF
jgi:sterol desaturase/sphingolipid hydroxylase (fatty acid hydroxylase superfamily)